MTLLSRYLGTLLWFLFLALFISPVSNGNLWWHLKLGQQILEQGPLLHESLSLLHQGKFLINHSWLSDAIMAIAYNLQGLQSLEFLFAGIATLAFYFAFRRIPSELASLFTIIVFLLCVFMSQFAMGARPQILTFLFFSIYLHLIEGVLDRRTSSGSLIWIPILMLFWVNLHGGFVWGIFLLLALLFTAGCESFIGKPNVISKLGAPWFFVILGSTLLASFANPYGLDLWKHLFRELSSGGFHAQISNWQSPNFSNWSEKIFILLTLLGCLCFLFSKKKPPLWKWLFFFGITFICFLSTHYIPIFALTCTPWIARYTKIIWDALTTSNIEPEAPPFYVHVFCIALSIFVIIGTFNYGKGRLSQLDLDIQKQFPVQAARYIQGIKRETPLRLFNEYDWGGYLLWKDIPVFVDSRALMLYEESFLIDYFRILNRKRSWQPFFEKHDINAVLLKTSNPLTRRILRDDDWKLETQDVLAHASFIVKKKPAQHSSSRKTIRSFAF